MKIKLISLSVSLALTTSHMAIAQVDQNYLNQQPQNLDQLFQTPSGSNFPSQQQQYQEPQYQQPQYQQPQYQQPQYQQPQYQQPQYQQPQYQQPQYYPQPYPQPPSNGQILRSALTAGIGSALTTGVAGGLGSLIGGLFYVLSNKLFGPPEKQKDFIPTPFPPQPQPQPQVSTTHSLPVSTSVIGFVPTGNIPPSIAHKIEQLDPLNFTSIRTFENVDFNTPSLNTGDIFAITFETNMPGQVRLENLDASNVYTLLGTYNVLGRKQTRLPKTKGFQLTGNPGTEQINIYFTPCRPPEALDATGVKEFSLLPVCSNNQSTNLAKAGKSGGIRAKAVLNLESPDPTIAVSVTPDYTNEDLQNGQPVMKEIKLFHQGVTQQVPQNSGPVNGVNGQL